MCQGPRCPPGAGPSPVAAEAQDPEAGTPGRCRGASRDGAHHTRPHRPLSRPLPAAEGCLGGLRPVSLPGRYGRACGSSHVSQRKYWASGHVSKGHTGQS